MAKRKKILVFTGGGLAPALNATLYGVIKQAQDFNWQILGGLYGWACLDKKGQIIDLSQIDPEPLKNVGGTILRSSRTNPAELLGGVKAIKQKIKALGIDCVAAIGGNDTLAAAAKLAGEGIKIIGLPKTIDNDIPGTYWSPGFPSAAFYISSFCREIKEDAAYALSRIYVIETLGAFSGWLAGSAAYGLADAILVPEKNFAIDKVINLIYKRYKKNGNFATLVLAKETNFAGKTMGVAERQKDQFGVQRTELTGWGLKQILQAQLGIDTKLLLPGAYAQTGKPTAVDKKWAIKLGQEAIKLIAQGESGLMVGLSRTNWRNDNITINKIDLRTIDWTQLKKLDDSYFDFDNLTVKQKYLDYLEPILGKYKNPDGDYYRLINKVVLKKKG